MKKIKKSMLLAVLLLLTVFTIPTKANAAVKISKKSVTLTEGQSTTLKITGTTSKVTWSSSKKTVATVTQKGKVTAKKAGTTKITAKVGNKKYTCKVTVKKSNESNSKSKNGVQYKDYAIEGGVVVVAKNTNSYTVEVNIDCIFYRSGKMIKKASDSEYALEAGRECALRAYNFDDKWDSYKISIRVERESNIVGNARNIKVSSNFGDENVMVTVTNNGQKNEFTRIAIVFYSGGKVIGYDESYANVDNKGDKDYLEFMFPFGYDYETIMPDNYKIYVNSSYRYSWA